MALRYPTKLFHRITDITPELLAEMNARALLLDVDNTLSRHGEQTPYPGAVEWVERMRKAGYRLVILSNNTHERVQPFAAQFGLEFITFAMKPLPVGYLRAARQLKIPTKQCVIIGDQVYTDIIGANLCGMKSLLLDPIEEETSRSFRMPRKWERSIRPKMAARQQADAKTQKCGKDEY